MKLLSLSAIATCLLTVFGCASFQTNLDLSGLRDINKQLLADDGVGTPEDLTGFLEGFDPFGVPVVEPAEIHEGPLTRWNLKEGAYPQLKQARLSFPSPLGDEAVFYLYYEGSLEGKKVILWVPGYGVSDLAFVFLPNFFRTELAQGYAILFYTLPFHLERTVPGKSPGDGLLTLNTVKTLRTFSGVIAELRTGVEYLRSQGVTSFSGWGGSVGAALLWTLSTRESLEQMTLMIPVVDWTTLLFHAELAPTLGLLQDRGFSRELLARAYAPFSPQNTHSLTDPGRIQVLYARRDQLTPEASTLAFLESHGILHFRGYNESHGTILLNSTLYQDYAAFLAVIPQ